MDQVRDIMRRKHYSGKTEQNYLYWMKRYIFFHHKRHPRDMGVSEIEAFLTYLAVKEMVSASTQNQAFNALLFLYRRVLGVSLEDENISAIRAARKKNIPIVLTREEVFRLLTLMSGTVQLMARLLYGSGLRVMECVRLRVQNIDFGMGEITVRDGKGSKDRLTILPESLVVPLQEQIERVRVQHQQDMEKGFGSVYLPYGLERKYRNAHKEFTWQFLFPASDIALDIRTGIKRRHHMHESNLQPFCEESCKTGRYQQAGDAAHPAAFLCHASINGRLRHPHRAGTARPQGCFHHHDLYPCPAAEGDQAGEKSAGCLSTPSDDAIDCSKKMQWLFVGNSAKISGSF